MYSNSSGQLAGIAGRGADVLQLPNLRACRSRFQTTANLDISLHGRGDFGRHHHLIYRDLSFAVPVWFRDAFRDCRDQCARDVSDRTHVPARAENDDGAPDPHFSSKRFEYRDRNFDSKQWTSIQGDWALFSSVHTCWDVYVFHASIFAQ
ncbi:hypothetical protein D3C81_887610 [compost metagenome]